MNNKQLLAKVREVIHAQDLNKRLEENKDGNTDAIFTAFHAASDLIEHEYHEPEAILEIIEETMSEYDNDDEVDEDTLTEMLNEKADSACPIYYNEIAKWFANGNWTAVDECFDNGMLGAPERSDIMKHIQGAFVYTLENEARATLTNIISDIENK